MPPQNNNWHLIASKFPAFFRALIKYGAALTSLLSVGAYAHHSTYGQFDKESVVEKRGVVTKIEWRNPHASIYLEIPDATGEIIEWRAEAGGATQLARVGMKRDLLDVGDTVLVAGWPPITDKKEVFITNLQMSDGKEYLLHREAKPRWTDHVVGDSSFQFKTQGDPSRPELGIFRIWSHTDVSPFLFPEDLDPNYDQSVYPMTAAAKNTLEKFDRTRDNPTRNCTPKGMPTIMEQPYPMEIAQERDTILMHLEEYDTRRRIRMFASEDSALNNLSQFEAGQNRPLTSLGYSVGYWQGKTLVVMTTGISWPWFDQAGIPQSEESKLEERFTPTEDGSRMDYQLTVTDPVNFTEPVTLTKYWLDIPGREVLPYECTSEG